MPENYKNPNYECINRFMYCYFPVFNIFIMPLFSNRIKFKNINNIKLRSINKNMNLI